ncbi:MAG: hypothetical protein JWO36_4076 [Myxococcales bacterium]|nr:hypothetical protein [Myxococcales bacterium]
MMIWQSTIAALLLICGCGPSSMQVYNLSRTDNGGVPFFPLIAVNKEIRRYDQLWTRVEVLVKEQVAYQKGAKPTDTEWREVAMTSSYYLCNSATHSNADQLEFPHTIAKAFSDVSLSSPEDSTTTAKAVEDLLKRLASDYCSTDAGSLLGSPDDASVKSLQGKNLMLLGLERSTDQVPSPTPNYLNVRVPRGGSANADIKLDVRGTLSEAIGQRQDQLPAAVVAAVGTLGAAALGGVATVAAAGFKGASLIELNPPRVPFFEKPKVGDHVISTIGVTTTVKHRIYAVTMLWPVALPTKIQVAGNGSGSGRSVPGETWQAFDTTSNPCVNVSAGDTNTNCIVNVTVSDDTIQNPAPPAAVSAASSGK